MGSFFHGWGDNLARYSMGFRYPEQVRYHCEKCALCCGDTEHKVRMVLLMKSEANQISEKNKLCLEEFAQKIEGFEPYIYRMKMTKDRKCVFLKNNYCSIYRIRPLVCRFYPFQLKPITNEYVFKYTDECPGIGKGPRLKRAFFKDLFEQFTESMYSFLLDKQQSS